MKARERKRENIKKQEREEGTEAAAKGQKERKSKELGRQQDERDMRARIHTQAYKRPRGDKVTRKNGTGERGQKDKDEEKREGGR